MGGSQCQFHVDVDWLLREPARSLETH
ncbi:MAG: hypothetical protein RL410_65, partial [Actinomycetota bacterium]